MAEGGEEGELGIAVQGVSRVPSWDGGRKRREAHASWKVDLQQAGSRKSSGLFIPGKMGSLCFFVSEKQIGIAKQSTGWKISWMNSTDLVSGVIELER